MPPHAPCRLQRGKEKCNEISASLPPHAPCRLQRFINSTDEIEVHLCLHTLRADCNGKEYRKPASHNLCLHTLRADCNLILRTNFLLTILCLHTLRADCNMNLLMLSALKPALPPHAPCRLQQLLRLDSRLFCSFASTRSVQIATRESLRSGQTLTSLPPHAPCRLQRQKCTELQYALFRTCVELVDSFSVLNKAMLR